MGRKRNQGKARKAAKARAKAREEAEEESNNQVTNERQQPLAALLEETEEERGSDKNQTTYERQQSLAGCGAPIPPSEFFNTKCRHISIKADNTCAAKFAIAFEEAYHHHYSDKDGDVPISECLIAAEDATLDKFAAVWNDSAKMESVISYFLYGGTQYILAGNYDNARQLAVFARYIEQQTAVELHQTQALANWPKIQEMFDSDIHTLVKFFWKRIQCACLDEKYEEVKNITKMGFCYNPECKFPNRMPDRRNTMYCSRCRCVTYCSPECQKADWKLHRSACDKIAAMKAEFDAKQQNT
eukprot:scaffold3941_cov78-Skeletonema_dohrnii-CCMP3373.AAC.4